MLNQWWCFGWWHACFGPNLLHPPTKSNFLWTPVDSSDPPIHTCHFLPHTAQRIYLAQLTPLNCPIHTSTQVVCFWNVMAHAQEPDFVFRRNGRVHLNRRGRQFSRPPAAEVCASAVVMLDRPRSEVVWRVLATHSIHEFPLHFPSSSSSCAITFQLDSTNHYKTLTQLPKINTIR